MSDHHNNKTNAYIFFMHKYSFRNFSVVCENVMHSNIYMKKCSKKTVHNICNIEINICNNTQTRILNVNTTYAQETQLLKHIIYVC
jgi:hypothetical protein